MLGNVRCGYDFSSGQDIDEFPYSYNRWTLVACADISTGISVLDWYNNSLPTGYGGDVDVAKIAGGFYDQILLQMPIFEMLSQINTLNSYLSHAQAVDVNSWPGLARVDPGYPEFRVMVDVNGDGQADYCRFVGNPGAKFLSCALAITSRSFGNYFGNYDVNSMPGLAGFDPGYPEFRVMVDVNGDERADYCRFVGNPGAEFLSCALATSNGHFRNYYRPTVCLPTDPPLACHFEEGGKIGIRVHVVLTMSTLMVSTGSWRANAHHSGFIQQIGAFRVIRLTMTLSVYPTPPAVHQASRTPNEGHIQVKCLFTRQKRLSLPS
jgi:hypothetical protein